MSLSARHNRTDYVHHGRGGVTVSAVVQLHKSVHCSGTRITGAEAGPPCTSNELLQ